MQQAYVERVMEIGQLGGGTGFRRSVGAVDAPAFKLALAVMWCLEALLNKSRPLNGIKPNHPIRVTLEQAAITSAKVSRHHVAGFTWALFRRPRRCNQVPVAPALLKHVVTGTPAHAACV
jgi:hypothetical protein